MIGRSGAALDPAGDDGVTSLQIRDGKDRVRLRSRRAAALLPVVRLGIYALVLATPRD
jgi:hypothetical protein